MVLGLWCNFVSVWPLHQTWPPKMWGVNHCVWSFWPCLSICFYQRWPSTSRPCAFQSVLRAIIWSSVKTAREWIADCNWCSRLHSLSNLCMNPAVWVTVCSLPAFDVRFCCTAVPSGNLLQSLQHLYRQKTLSLPPLSIHLPATE